ncbi:LrgB family protein [Desertibacillus haloalkaliphilus]|uniref:LrgB family protein n=1 Tax=Desertibacillus haloalkaliphilus TaxID=1328930 RepID=UPI001C27EBDD|nr:LrgB family protein [Desertibacillus haloalkaliphilus]MBU8905258.1 LrgB family protein [Desertibacillus haloalkaliphilus]
MKEFVIALIAISFTVFIYMAAKKFNQRFPNPFTLPLLVGTAVMVIFFVAFQIDYDTYMIGGQWIEMLLGPAVVALAYPLYKQWEMLKTYFVPIMTGVLIGAVIGVVSGLQLAKWLGVEEEVIYSLVPKSVTTPVAMDVAATLGGAPPLAAIFVMVAGLGGVVLSPYVLRWFKIDHYLGKGIGIGSASHAIGTAKALENGEKEGAASSVAMTLSAIVVSIIGPMLVFLIY